MNIKQLFNDYGIIYATEGNKHTSPGWVNIHCPFCEGSQNFHLGYHLINDYFTCYRCGWHSTTEVLSNILQVDWKEAKSIVKLYGGSSFAKVDQSKIVIRKKSHKLPTHTMPLQANHKKYLEDRGFDADYLEKEWSLVGTGPISMLDHLNYKHRIVIPFFWDNVQVSFDTRDITGKAMNKYQACPLERETIPHKEIIFGKQEKWKDVGICVEGPFDVFRFGVNSFATSGIKFVPKQVRLIAKTFKRVAICFDGPSETSQELEAYNQANILVSELKLRNVDAFRVDIKGDPGKMSQEESNYLVKQLIS
jgi:hypothetical protein